MPRMLNSLVYFLPIFFFSSLSSYILPYISSSLLIFLISSPPVSNTIIRTRESCGPPREVTGRVYSHCLKNRFLLTTNKYDFFFSPLTLSFLFYSSALLLSPRLFIYLTCCISCHGQRDREPSTRHEPATRATF